MPLHRLPRLLSSPGRADLYQLHTNAVAYNSPGDGGGFGDPCALALSQRHGRLCILLFFVSAAGTMGLNCHRRMLGAEFIKLAARLLEDARVLIAAHLPEIQAAEARIAPRASTTRM